ncbi:MAG: diguanylate cyclase [Rhodospirillales bacterium]|nr:diguanylate cyclase [Rhodospirillales bacterium]
MLRLQDLRPYLSELARHFIAAFLPFSLALAAFLFSYTWFERNQALTSLSGNETIRIETAKNATQSLLNEVVADLGLLSNDQILQEWLETPSPGALKDVTNHFLLIARTKRIYDQIRLLDLSGKERLRVNFSLGRPYSVPDGELHDKSNRYYFSESVNLTRGHVFLSPLDLNVENEEIERPMKPMIRLATPVFDRQGIRRGVLVMNYLAQHLLGKLGEAASGIQGELMLVNGEGFWLLSPRHEDEWGFQLNSGKRFDLTHARAWRQIQAGQTSIQNESGYYTATAMRPAILSQKQAGGIPISTGSIPAANYVWWLISHIPEPGLSNLVSSRTNLHVAFVFALFLIGVLSFSYAAMRVARIRSDENLKQAAKVMEVTHDAVLILCPNRKILSVNQAAAAITGFLPSELMGADERMTRAHQDEVEREETIWAQVEDHGQWQGEIWNRRKNGEAYPAYATIGRITDHKGRLQNYIEIFSDITDRKLEEQALLKLAHHDPLTGLPNRALFLDRLEVALATAKRAGHKASVLFIDLDKFKPVNDELGHEAGDILLCEIAKRLQAALREADTVARFGGDEFVVLLPEIDHDHDALTVAGSLIERVRDEIMVKGHACHVGCSIGIAFFPGDADVPLRLVEQADQAMYRAKQTGSGTIRMAGRELPDHPIPARRYLKPVT